MPTRKYQDPSTMTFKKAVGGTPSPISVETPKPGASTSLPITPEVTPPSVPVPKKPDFATGHKGQRRYDKEFLRTGWSQIGGKALDFLLRDSDQGEGISNFDLMVARAAADGKIKDIFVMLGIATEKVLLMEGQPTQIVGHAESQKLDELMPKLLEEMKRRGTKVQLTERKAEIELKK